MQDVIIIGAGPCGLSAAITCKRAGFQPLVIEKGCLVNSVYDYPLSMHFFSTPEKLEIGDVPFISITEKPSRYEALKYYRTVAQRYQLKIHTYETVTQLDRLVNGFRVVTQNRDGVKVYQTRYVIVATGYYDQPHLLNIPGENLPHVHHYFRDAHPYVGQKAIVIGARNSAVDVALDLQQAGADVTMIYRRTELSDRVKPWVKPLIEGAIQHGRIKMHWESQVKEITAKSVIIEKKGKRLEVPADVVFAMTGYRPSMKLLEQLGVKVDPVTGIPPLTEQMETTIPGCYLAGVVATGNDSNNVFIENGRFHGQAIVEDLRRKANIQH